MDRADNRRRHARGSTALAARIFPSGFPCQILDISPRGMRLQLETPLPMADSFIVVEWASGDAHDAQAIWIREGEVGVQVLRTCDLRDRAPFPFAEAKAAWLAERAADPEVA